MTQYSSSLRATRGFTLIELMVAMALGLLLVAGIGYAYVSTKQTYRQQEGLARIQESARYAFEILTNDLRMAGFTGCGSGTTANTLNDPSWYLGLYTLPLLGFEGGVSTFPADISALVTAGTDAVVILRANTDNEYIINHHNAPSAQFDLTEVSDLVKGEVMIACDYQHSAVFQMSGPASVGTAQVVHNTGEAGVTPGNCTKGLGAPVDCTNPLGTEYTFAPGSRLLRLQGNLYYIGTGESGAPALFRRRLVTTNPTNGNPTTESQELVDGVESMQITYGVDTTGVPDDVIDAYYTADQIVAGTIPGGNDPERWARVLSVKISLLMRAMDDFVTTDQQTYVYNGATTTAADKRLRKVFTTVVAVRNRL